MVTYGLMIAFAALLIGLAIPFSYGVRMMIFLALVALSILTFIGGSMHYFYGLLPS